MANGDLLTGPPFPEEWYRGRSPLGFPVRLGLLGEARGEGQGGVAPTAGVVPPLPGGPSPGAAEATLAGQRGGAVTTAGRSWLDLALRLGPKVLDLLGAPTLSHARPAELEQAWQAQRLGERLPAAQALIAAGWTPQQIEAAQSVLGPLSAWEQQHLTPQDLQQIAGLMEGRVGDITIGMPPELVGPFAEAATGGAETALREGLAAGGLSPQAAQTLGLATTPISLMGSFMSLPMGGILAENLGPEAATAIQLASAAAAPFTFGLSTFAPVVVAALSEIFGSPSRYQEQLQRTVKDLEMMIPLWSAALPYARSEADLQFLANLYNPWASSAQFFPDRGLEVYKRELEPAAERFNEAWRQALAQVRQTWGLPWQGPSMQEALRQWIIDQFTKSMEGRIYPWQWGQVPWWEWNDPNRTSTVGLGLPGWGIESRRVGHVLGALGLGWDHPAIQAALDFTRAWEDWERYMPIDPTASA